MFSVTKKNNFSSYRLTKYFITYTGRTEHIGGLHVVHVLRSPDYINQVWVLDDMDLKSAQLWFYKARVSVICCDSHNIPFVFNMDVYTGVSGAFI